MSLNFQRLHETTNQAYAENFRILTQKMADPLLNPALHFLIGIPFAFPFSSKIISLWLVITCKLQVLTSPYKPYGNDMTPMRHEKTVSVSKIRLLWEPWEEDETPRN